MMRRYVMYVDPALCSIRIAVEPVKKDDEYHFEYDYDYDHELLSLLCLCLKLENAYIYNCVMLHILQYIYIPVYVSSIYMHIYIYTPTCVHMYVVEAAR